MRVQPAGWRFILVLLACLAVSLSAVVYPMYVIRPFRTQGARELAVAPVDAAPAHPQPELQKQPPQPLV